LRQAQIAWLGEVLSAYPPLTLHLHKTEKEGRILLAFFVPRINAVRFHVIQNK
jgi:hypothetical protein